jgi:Flp pilus assembly protein TadG
MNFIRGFRATGAEKGQALIEFALMLPLLLLLIVNVVNFGGFFYAWITVANAARAGADYAIMGGASAGNLTPASGAQIVALINADISSLPNASSVAVGVCQNNGTQTVITGSCSMNPADPEAPDYVMTTVQVTYTYTPFIPASFQFANLGVYATLPPLTITRRAFMRSMS